MGIQLISAGAAGTVTGSCHLIEVRGKRFLIDCGLFQGQQVEALDREGFPFDPAGLDAVLLTHGHLDHVGRLPLLAKAGYSGPIFTLHATSGIAEVILLDSARLGTHPGERVPGDRDARRPRRRVGRPGQPSTWSPRTSSFPKSPTP
jgi:metallo-beta-lactamase family protein